MTDQLPSIDAYVSTFPDDVQVVLEEVRQAIHRAVPTAAETISYQIPTMTLDGTHLVYFAGWKRFVSVYPVPTTDTALTRDLAPYKAGKGTVRFPLGEPIPRDLIERLVAALVHQRGDRGANQR